MYEVDLTFLLLVGAVSFLVGFWAGVVTNKPQGK